MHSAKGNIKIRAARSRQKSSGWGRKKSSTRVYLCAPDGKGNRFERITGNSLGREAARG